MTHRTVIEAGPASIRRLCCGAKESAAATAVLEWIDDPVALVDGQPVEMPELLRSAIACREPADAVEIIHPSWWPARRVQLFTTAARGLAGDVIIRSRAAVLAGAYRDSVIVEIAAQLVAITAADITAEPRIGSPAEVAASVARRVLAAVDRPKSVVIDGSGALATLIAERLQGECQVTVVDELPLKPAAEPTVAPAPEPSRTRLRPVAVAAALGVVALALRVPHAPPPDPATYLVEGRIAVQVPAGWPVRRVTNGPGSARVEITSPTDPDLVLHFTQAPAVGGTLAAVAEALHKAQQLADVDTPGVFVGFDPSGTSAGRPAVTYREVRDGHHVDWAVLVDHAVRIGIGCQGGPGDDDAVLRPVCERAVRSAHAIS